MRATGGTRALIIDYSGMLLIDRDVGLGSERVRMVTGISARAMVMSVLTACAAMGTMVVHRVAKCHTRSRHTLEGHRDHEKAKRQQFEETAHPDESVDLIRKTCVASKKFLQPGLLGDARQCHSV